MMSSARVGVEVERRVTQAYRTFGTLRRTIYKNCSLTTKTKQAIYEACVVSVLLYESEGWAPLHRHLYRLDVVHHRYL